MKMLFKEILGREKRVISYSSPEDTLLRRVVINSIELSTGRSSVEKAYRHLTDLKINDASIWNHVFPLLDIELNFNRTQLDNTAVNGPLVVIANHPYGVADGMALGYILSQIRQDFFLIVNEVLCRERVLGKYFLPIDFRETRDAVKTNIDTRRRALLHLSRGGAIGIFPSGGVSTTPKLLSKTAIDLEWKRFVIRLVKNTRASVLPIFFEGQNSASFQIASHIHPNIRLALLINELRKKRRKSLNFTIGKLITPDDMNSIERDDLLDFLRDKTFELGHT